MEPRAAVAEWNGDRLTVWAGCDGPFRAQRALAEEFGIPTERVRVIIPDMGGFQDQWVNAIKSGSLKTSCDFDYAGTLVETMALGLVAYQAGKKINYDGKKGRVTNNDEADALLSRPIREGWALDG